jgi:hypothetical protein
MLSVGGSVGGVVWRSVLPVAATCFLVAACSGGRGSWFVPMSPKLRVNVAAGCPSSDAAVADVVNTFSGPPLVAANPVNGLICRYGARPGSGLPDSGLLVRSKVLDHDQATQLDDVIRQLNLAKPSGVFHCPADVGFATIIGFSYPGRSDVGLWYQASGCRTLDNGRLGAFQGANPSFGAFESLIDGLLPPVTI